MKNRRRVILSALLFTAALLFFSCSWFSSGNDDSEDCTFTITGSLYANGALPQSIAESTVRQRTAVASLPNSISYKVYLLASENADITTALCTATATTSGTPAVISYEMKYNTGDTSANYYLRAIGYDTKGTDATSDDVAIIASPNTLVTFTPLTEVFEKDLELRPITGGSGEVLLNITYPI